MNRLLTVSFMAALVAACDRVAEPVSANKAAAAAIVASYTPVDLGTLPGGTTSSAADINDRGVVVGSADNAAGQSRAVRWTASDGMTDLGVLPGGSQSKAVRILNSGKILGEADTPDGRMVAVQWNARGQIAPLNIPRLPHTELWSVHDFNQRGEVVGYSLDSLNGNSFEHGWYWSSEAGLVDLRDHIPACFEMSANAINASGVVAGAFCHSLFHPFIWRLHGEYIDLGVGDDPMNSGIAEAINNAGVVAGTLETVDEIAPFIWTRAKGFTLLPGIPADRPTSAVQALNSAAIVVGGSFDGDFLQPVVWPSTTTLVRLNHGPVSRRGIATAINDRGQIVGITETEAGVYHARLWRPEAGTEAGGSRPEIATTGPIAPADPRAAPSALASCLADRNARLSRLAMAECLIRK